jgi:hypothetical protein
MSDLNADAIRNSLLNSQWKKAGELELEGEAGKVLLFVRRPPPKAHLAKLQECRERGLVDSKDEPTTPNAALEMAAILFAPMLFLPGAVVPLFTPEQFVALPFFMEACEACKKAIAPVSALVEDAKKN